MDGLGAWFQETVLSGPLLVALPVALLAGLVSFASPCVLPLVPGYLGYVGGMAGADLETIGGAEGRAKRRLLAGVLLFVAGFSVVFVGLSLVFVQIGVALTPWLDVVTRVLGVVVVLMGLAFLGWIPFLAEDRRLRLAPRTGLAGAGLLGVTFGLGWAPCIGPTLAAITILALPTGSPARGAILALVYCLGLGLPFLLLALAFQRFAGAMSFLRRHRLAIMRIGGAMLVLVGLALVTGVWGRLIAVVQGWVGGFVTVV
ncbi:cytochrome c biogenesis protein CcdA [Salana multivorans]|uniref:Cytochrome c biogenesis protein CcdA n=1 Tax=Salana multivorans TaxID=120377 RepID=A0A3N2D8I4_9MICO|nr:cytochrome c biogenesis protein CcdA [Salana multivorans]OJX97520.1 MAG: cytochrome C biogenesis protein ResC [Micrococcales bacterium 73-15]ROR96093.1 cytochrome c biogenesis protein CcdA [Salana multivorans]